jgi:mannose-6-phosphate isomerase-like protein (cupin superfamily)
MTWELNRRGFLPLWLTGGILAARRWVGAQTTGRGLRVKRAVTGHDRRGKAVFLFNDNAPRRVQLDSAPGFELIEIWNTEGAPGIPVSDRDVTATMKSFVPGPDGTQFRLFRIPGSGSRPKDFRVDPEAIRKEYAAKVPGLAESGERDNPGMHTTDTIDYGVVISGRITLELDDGAEVELGPGDCWVQNGTRHAWRNRSVEDFVGAAVLVGARRKQG